MCGSCAKQQTGRFIDWLTFGDERVLVRLAGDLKGEQSASKKKTATNK